jgi:hypothetical protein
MDAINVYNRCMGGKPYTEDFKIYSKSYLQKAVKELEQIDEFEKCIELKKFINKRFNHSENYLLDLF